MTLLAFDFPYSWESDLFSDPITWGLGKSVDGMRYARLYEFSFLALL